MHGIAASFGQASIGALEYLAPPVAFYLSRPLAQQFSGMIVTGDDRSGSIDQDNGLRQAVEKLFKLNTQLEHQILPTVCTDAVGDYIFRVGS
jgi:hypothetical protein